MRWMGFTAAAAAFFVLGAVATSGTARADGDATAGQVIFKKCALCHSPDTGVNKIGPSLHGIVGRHSASIANFNYSPAMKAFDKTWDAAQLDTYLTDPKSVVPGTKMIFPGLKEEKDRQDVIAYLSTLK
ncbi:cytochrome C protein [Aliidongia dinghuensis]|uniref:Cytochrome C protein n=2 Tax=Aliidongia dinghuensis TaxID=1867774 RepID=A0A8J2YPA2_9PROT|nr:cytochrome C protein [Aliidongia dinghuensis]